MSKSRKVFESLPELPVELFELSARLDWSDSAPVITNRPTRMESKKPRQAKAAASDVKRSSVQTKRWFGWATYPHIVCHHYPEPQLAAMKFEDSPAPRPDSADLGAIARFRRHFRLTRLHGDALPFGWVCQLHHGPWFMEVEEQESCEGDSFWTLESASPGVYQSWWGSWDDRPDMLNLQVFVDINSPAHISPPTCCGGYHYCPTTMSCIPLSVPCMGQHPT